MKKIKKLLKNLKKEKQLTKDNSTEYTINVLGGEVNIANDHGKIMTVEKIDCKSDDNNKIIRFNNNKKQYYLNNWNSRLFLHLDNDDNPITLKDAFIMPKCTYRVVLGVIKSLNEDSFDTIIDNFVKYERSSNLSITGIPGIGKSTVTSWFADRYYNDDRCIILRFRDWEYDELEAGLLKAICNMLGCKKRDLENKILILDGYDEMKALDIREKVLNTFLNDIKDIDHFKCIVTSRPAYIDTSCFYNKLNILPFDISQIEMFYRRITGFELNYIIDSQNLEVLGVPVILYMAIMSNIDITKGTSKPELYNCIFAEKGGIFDRFCEYDNGSQILRDIKNIRIHLKFMRQVAFKMYEKKDLQIKKDECEIPELEYKGKNVNILEFPIKHLFENTNPNIEFIHRSIYEYFVSEYIFDAIKEKINQSANELASTFGYILKQNSLSIEILEFLKYRLKNSEINDIFNKINDAFQLMLCYGMTYFIETPYENNVSNVIECEKIIFANMLEVIHLWEEDCIGLILSETNYLKCSYDFGLNLSTFNFIGADLVRADLSYANLTGADLTGADLSYAILNQTDLKNSRLTDSVLKFAHIRNVEIIGAEISEHHVKFLENEIDLHGTKVYISKTDSIVSYEEYCRIREKERKRKKDKLETMGIDFSDFMNMSKNEKIEVLKNAKLNPADFDIFL